MAAFLAGTGGVATGVVAMDTSHPPSNADVSSSGIGGLSDTTLPPEERVGQQDSQSSQTGFQEPVQPLSVTPGTLEQWQWPQSPPDHPESFRLTATNPDLAQVLPSGPVATGVAAAQQGITTIAYDGADMQSRNMIGGHVVGGYDPAYLQSQATPPVAAGSYFPPPYASPQGPYDYQYGAPPPPVGGGVGDVPSYGQQFSSPAPSQSYASTANWGSFDSGGAGTGNSDVPSRKEPSVPYVDRSTKPSSLSALSTGWGGESVVNEHTLVTSLIPIPTFSMLFAEKWEVPGN